MRRTSSRCRLARIITNLVIYSWAEGGRTNVYWDIALRGFGLLLGALALGRKRRGYWTIRSDSTSRPLWLRFAPLAADRMICSRRSKSGDEDASARQPVGLRALWRGH
jgi:hypothetical protein